MIKLKNLLFEIGEGTFHYNIKRKNSILTNIDRYYQSGNPELNQFDASFVSDSNTEYTISLRMEKLSSDNYEAEVVFSSTDEQALERQKSNLNNADIVFDSINQTKPLILIPNYKGTSFNGYASKRKLKPKEEVDSNTLSQLLNRLTITADSLYDLIHNNNTSADTINKSVKPLSSFKLIKSGKAIIHTTDAPYAWLTTQKGFTYIGLIVDTAHPEGEKLLKEIRDWAQPLVSVMSNNVVTNKGEALKVVSTVVHFVKEVSNILPLKQIKFNPAKREEEADIPLDQTGRGKLYLAFVKKQYPNAIVQVTNDYIKVNSK